MHRSRELRTTNASVRASTERMQQNCWGGEPWAVRANGAFGSLRLEAAGNLALQNRKSTGKA